MNNTLTDRVLCWHCNRPLVGKGGSWKARPLYFALVMVDSENAVKVHKCCQIDARASVRHLTAQPTSAAQMDAQLEDQLGGD